MTIDINQFLKDKAVEFAMGFSLSKMFDDRRIAPFQA